MDEPDEIGKTGKLNKLEEFAEEIRQDLAKLSQQYPRGITVAALMDWYGEPVSRCTKVFKVMQKYDDVVVYKNSHGAFALHSKELLQDPLAKVRNNLTTTQVKILDYLLSQPKLPVTTNFSELARTVKCSYGGVTQAIRKLTTMGLIKVIGEPRRGRPDGMSLTTPLRGRSTKNPHLGNFLEMISHNFDP